MSKQSDAKEAQGWRKEPDTCCRCANFTKDVVEKHYEAWDGQKVWTEDKNLRCGLGGFKTGKSNTCDKFYPLTA